MAYKYIGSATTQEGKVIYRREKHAFTPKDLRRIIRHIRYPDEVKRQGEWIMALLKMLEFALWIGNDDITKFVLLLEKSLLGYYGSVPEFEDFGGGESGGGGATTIFDLPFDIIEEDETEEE